LAKREIKYGENRFELAYEIKNLDKQRTILFLHGWGSNKEVMQSAFKERFEDFRHIYLDMPGFGKSTCAAPLKTKDYAAITEEFLSGLNINPDIIIGHSFGGKVATLLGPKLLVLLSSAGIVWKKPFKIRAKIAIFKLLKPFGRFRNFFVSQDVRGMDEVMYKTFKNVVDEDFEKVFENYEGNAVLFWGKDDSATPLKSGEKIDGLIKESSLHIFEGDHYFFLKKGLEIEKKVKEEYEKLQV